MIFLYKQGLAPQCGLCRDGKNRFDDVEATISTERCTYIFRHIKVNYCPECGRLLADKNKI